ARFDMAIAAVGPRPSKAAPAADAAPAAVPAAVPAPGLAEGSAPIDDEAEIIELEPDDVEPVAEGPRLLVGPIRSGVTLDVPGHVIVMGDVNPGAEIRSCGNIVVLGRLRGVAHAGVGREDGFVLALCLEPQQVRIGRLAARAGADDGPGEGTEIAYATDKTIVVERYQGRLPSGLLASM